MSRRDSDAQRIIRTYLTITGLFNGALALIWGVNTLFLLQAGLDIFHVMLVNAAFASPSSCSRCPPASSPTRWGAGCRCCSV